MKLGFLAQGGTPDVDVEEAHSISRRVCDQNRARQVPSEQKPSAWSDRAVYAAAYNSTAQVPTDGSEEGVQTMFGRVWVEGRSLTHSAGAAASTITVVASQNGVRAQVECPAGTTLAGGSFRFWLQDQVTKKWGLGGVDEPLTIGVQRVWCTDQFTTVGGR